MITTKKKFDSVEYKRQVQQQLHEEEEKLGTTEFLRKMRQDLLEDPTLGEWYRGELRKQGKTDTEIAKLIEKRTG